jgi:LCP family protein required for cell wall assembly
MDSPARPSPRPRRSGVQRLVLALGLFVSTSVLAAACAAGWGYWKLSHIDRVNVNLIEAGVGEPENYLIVGSDSRKQGDPVDPSAQGSVLGQRSDTIMVLRIDPQSGVAAMLSLPRDLWVPIAGRGGQSQRINVAYSMGKQTLVDTIQHNFGIRINHYLEIDFHGFQGLVNAIGGVPMWFDKAYRDLNSGLQIDHPGCVKLDGYSALAFVTSAASRGSRRSSAGSSTTRCLAGSTIRSS